MKLRQHTKSNNDSNLGCPRVSMLSALGALVVLTLAVPACTLTEESSFDPELMRPRVQGVGTEVVEQEDSTSKVAVGEAELAAPLASGSEGAVAEMKVASPPASGASPTAPIPNSNETAEVTPVEPAPPAGPPVPRATMTTSGRQLLDSCGNPFVVRGVEQIFGEQLPEGNDWVGLVEQIASSGANAVRVLAGTDTLDVADVDAVLQAAGDNGMVVYVTPYGGDDHRRWLEGADVRAMLAKHEKYIIIDAFGEPTFDDRARFLAESTAAISEVRSWGYRVPLTVTANQFGRDLPSLLELGAQIIGSDPLGNTVLGWQAYWSQTGYYQETYGMSLTEAVQAVSSAPFPIQLGLDRVTDFPSDQTADFGSLLSATEANDIGWLWWDWYNPYGNENNLTEDGSATSLTPTGQTVVNAHTGSILNTSKLACSPAG